MKVTSLIYDNRIKAWDVLFDFTIGEYLDSVRNVVEQNEFQRKRVTSSKSAYSLLGEDILQGCVIPPVVLALSNPSIHAQANTDFEALIRQNYADLLILDGLQRTYTLLDLESEAQRLGEDHAKDLREKTLRVEVYVGLNKLGILYRMLTLNTGQTPMSLRQQIEMLYSDLYKTQVGDVKFVREKDEEYASGPLELNFKDTVEGFTSYLQRDELPFERGELLENFKDLKKLSEETSTDLFGDFVQAWVTTLQTIESLCSGAVLNQENSGTVDISWGKNALQVFKKPQVTTGFGAALGKLKDLGLLTDVSDVTELSAKLNLGADTGEEFLLEVNKSLSVIKNTTKKIGNAQRMYFLYFFRELFNPAGDSTFNLTASAITALHRVKTFA